MESDLAFFHTPAILFLRFIGALVIWWWFFSKIFQLCKWAYRKLTQGVVFLHGK